MTKSLDLHPEELIDRLAAGDLTDPDRDRLRAHLSACASCRLEIAVRYALEDDDSPASFDESQLALAPEPRAAGREATPRKGPSARQRPLLLLSVAMVLCTTGGALATMLSGAVRTPPWARWSLDIHSPERTSDPSGPKRSFDTKRAKTNAVPTAESGVAGPAASDSPFEDTTATPPVEREARSTRAIPSTSSHAAAAESESERPGKSAAIPSFSSFPDPEPTEGVGIAEGPLPAAEPLTPARLFFDANRARRNGDVARALELYRGLDNRFPNAAESRLSHALVAKLLLDRGDAQGALAAFDRYLAEDSTALNAEALVGRSRALEQLGRRDEAATSWREVLRRFPGSVHARLASTRLSALDAR